MCFPGSAPSGYAWCPMTRGHPNLGNPARCSKSRISRCKGPVFRIDSPCALPSPPPARIGPTNPVLCRPATRKSPPAPSDNMKLQLHRPRKPKRGQRRKTISSCFAVQIAKCLRDWQSAVELFHRTHRKPI